MVEDSGKLDEVNTLAREVPVQELPDEVLGYLLGSRYCETDHLSNLAWSLFGNVSPGWSRVQAVTDYVHNRLSFGYGYARSTRTAAQAHDEQVGVCRDFAHLAITLCRCLNIPARYVNGYLGDIGVPEDPAPMDFSAWFEAFLDGKWYTFDARHNVPAHGPRGRGARPRRDRRAAAAQFRAAPARACSRSGPTSRKAIRPSRPITAWTGRSARICSPEPTQLAQDRMRGINSFHAIRSLYDCPALFWPRYRAGLPAGRCGKTFRGPVEAIVVKSSTAIPSWPMPPSGPDRPCASTFASGASTRPR